MFVSTLSVDKLFRLILFTLKAPMGAGDNVGLMFHFLTKISWRRVSDNYIKHLNLPAKIKSNPRLSKLFLNGVFVRFDE